MYINYFFINFLYKTKENQSSSRNRLQFFWQVNIQKALFFLYFRYTCTWFVNSWWPCQFHRFLLSFYPPELLYLFHRILSFAPISALIISSFSPPNLLYIYDVNFSLNTLASLLCLNLSNSMFHHEVFDIS